MYKRIEVTTEEKNEYADKLIINELSQVCSSKELNSKYKLCELLKYLVNETLSGRSEQLINYSIGIDIFNRNKDFNPELDPIVRIELGRLRNSLGKYYLNEGKNDPIRIFIPKGNYIPKFIPQEVLQSKSSEKQVEIEKKADELSIAVLPFTNLTGDPNQEYFVQGFTEELLTELSNYKDFRIIGIHITYMNLDNHHNEKELLESFGAKYLIEGSVRKDKYKVKISIKLEDAHTGECLWSEQFKRNLTPENLISMQEQIAGETAIIVANENGIIPQKIQNVLRKKSPAELETHEAIFLYYYYQTQHTPELTLAVFNALEMALIREPDNGAVAAMLASIYGNLYMLNLSPDPNLMDKMVELARKAEKLEPNNQIVRIVYAWSYFVLEEREHFLSEIDNALALNPKTPLRVGAIGFFLSLYGEWERGKKLIDDAMSRSIGFPIWYYGASTLYYYRLNEFEKAYDQALRYNLPAVFWGPMLRAAVLGQLGRKSDAQKDISELHALKPEFEKKAHYLISRYVKEEELVKHIIDGLLKAGLEIQYKPAHSVNIY